ncbi:anti-sigma regulatory factor [uncultured Draconibacterium sp.]|uniref:anti-sigma regulatory factor n=1 Tax=uncultured Draconibacterium sp. TaxID=1573823 RepID=UPI002AA7584A|nr:anti-sigma regulatory factor [uncultured Draconibacterium sp.]
MNEISFDNNWEQLGKYPIVTEHDIVKVRQLVRHHAKEASMGIVEQTRITTAVSELFRNMYNYAGGGEVLLERGNVEGKNALIVTCIDEGPGIENLELAMSDGYTSGMGMGYGLPGTKRLVDRFEIQSEKDKGTIVRVMKWR